MLICPICERPLSRGGAVYRCPIGHSFDIAREGYVNLSRAPTSGDTPAMLRARRAFLDTGHYLPLIEAIAAYTADGLAASAVNAPAAILDAGCGEGTYIAAVAAQLRERAYLLSTAICYGLDVSRAAARMAARRHHDITFVVASLKGRIPFADGSLAGVLNVFAPRNAAEFARVLAPGGLLLVVIPGERHLAEARAAFGLLRVEPEKERHVVALLAGDFTCAAVTPLEFPLSLIGEDLAHLIAMSPSAHHIAPETLERARQTPRFIVTASFILLAFRRR
jgi:23S rRNA (guanine745-N1)-methyltransferase